MQSDGSVIVRIDIDPGDMTEREQQRLSASLGREIRSIPGVSEVQRAYEEAPKGARPTEAITWGALLVALIPIALPELIAFLKNRFGPSNTLTTKMSLQLKDRGIRIEFDPAVTSQKDILDFAQELKNIIEPEPEPEPEP